MKSNNRNERKKFVLSIMSYMVHPYTAKEIHELCSVSLGSICSSLKRYCSQGLLKRKKNNAKIFEYNITQKGIERLEYLMGSLSIKEQIQLLVREKIRLL